MQIWSNLKALYLSGFFISPSHSSPLQQREPKCVEFTIPVTLSATYNIAARYCQPEVLVLHRQSNIQLLVHGATYTRDYWSGDGPPGQGFHGDQYSWVSTASLNGYPTIAIDRLGNGLSSHPDPTSPDLSYLSQVEVLHQVITAVRDGIDPLPHAFGNIIYAGHSYGSMIGDALVAKYPEDGMPHSHPKIPFSSLGAEEPGSYMPALEKILSSLKISHY